jgi:hypothetical protein
MQNVLRATGGQIKAPEVDWVSKLTGGQQTKLTWARVIESYENVPKAYKGFFETQLSNGQTFPYAVLAPIFEARGSRITEKIVCVFDNEIYILEKAGNSLATQCYPLNGIDYVELTSILLDSRLKISGVTKEGTLASSIVRFNSATDHLFTPILKKIRLASVTSKEAVQKSELEKFDPWLEQSYKFMNYARLSLLGGEKVIHAMLQPEIRKRLFTILGKTYYRTIAPTHACILTDRELIMIREEVLQGRKDNYGGIWDYISLNKIATLSVSQKDNNLLALSIYMLTNDHLEFLFQNSMKSEIDQLLKQFRKLKPV